MNVSLPTAELPFPDGCDGARRLLELGRPGESDAALLAAARRHAEECPGCRIAVRQQECLDARIAGVCRDVPVPTDLRQRIVLALEQASLPRRSADMGTPEPVTVTLSTPQVAGTAARRTSRRGWWVAAASLVAAAIVLPVGIRALLDSRADLLTEALIAESIADQTVSAALPLWPTAELPPLPASMKTGALSAPPRQLPMSRAAAFFFQVSIRGKLVEGRLIVVPVARLKNPPVATGFLARPATYPADGYCAASWVEGEFAYVCLVRGGEDALQALVPARAVAI